MYKYVPPERVDDLDNLKMRATPFNELNDPFECLYNLNPIVSEVEAASADDYNAEHAQVQVFLGSLIGQFGILCFSKRYDSMPMWAHYTKNHAGFVIEFDERHTFFKTTAEYIDVNYRVTKDLSRYRGFGSMRDVEYSDERLEIDLGDNVPFDAFFRKSRPWEYEEEVRTFRSLRECDDYNARIRLLSYPSAAITGVIAGLNSRPLYTKFRRFASETRFSHVRFQVTSLHRRKFKLTLTDL